LRTVAGNHLTSADRAIFHITTKVMNIAYLGVAIVAAVVGISQPSIYFAPLLLR
jgi:hypothetical protein